MSRARLGFGVGRVCLCCGDMLYLALKMARRVLRAVGGLSLLRGGRPRVHRGHCPVRVLECSDIVGSNDSLRKSLLHCQQGSCGGRKGLKLHPLVGGRRGLGLGFEWRSDGRGRRGRTNGKSVIGWITAIVAHIVLTNEERHRVKC